MLNDLRKPFLAVDRLRHDNGSVMLSRDRTRFEIRPKGTSTSEPHIWKNLRNADWSGWSEIRSEKAPASETAVLVEALDRLGLVEDAATSDELVSAEATDVRTAIEQTTEWLATHVCPRRGLIATLLGIRALLEADNYALRGFRLRVNGAATGKWSLGAEGLTGVVLGHQLAYIKRVAPLSLAAVAAVCDAITSSAHRRGIAGVRSLCGGVWDVRDVRIHLNTVAYLVRSLVAGDSTSLPSLGEDKPRRPRTGGNFARAAERFARRVVADAGLTRFQRALEEGDQAMRLGQGVFLHQYFITQRYVESILPVMQLRLKPELRQYVFRYFREELGHERHELQACRYLGIRSSEADSFVPLPFFAAYSEVLNTIATRSPISLMASILVAEGLPGTIKPIVGLLQKHGVLPAQTVDPSVSKHQALDVALDHPTMARRLLGNVPAISIETQAQALKDLALMLSINIAGWNMLADYYLDPSAPVAPEFLDSRLY